eukprot:gene12179-14110_t
MGTLSAPSQEKSKARNQENSNLLLLIKPETADLKDPELLLTMFQRLKVWWLTNALSVNQLHTLGIASITFVAALSLAGEEMSLPMRERALRTLPRAATSTALRYDLAILKDDNRLLDLYGLGYAKVFHINNFERSAHILRFNSGPVGYSCKIELKHYNVSIICYPDYAANLTNPPRSYVFVLIHPSDPALNREVSLCAVASAGSSAGMQGGNANWMTAREFETFSINGKFAFGVK